MATAAAAHFNFAQKVVDIPHFDLTLRPEIYASTNSAATAPTSARRAIFPARSLRCRARDLAPLRAQLRSSSRRDRRRVLAGRFRHRGSAASSTSRSFNTIRGPSCATACIQPRRLRWRRRRRPPRASSASIFASDVAPRVLLLALSASALARAGRGRIAFCQRRLSRRRRSPRRSR